MRGGRGRRRGPVGRGARRADHRQPGQLSVRVRLGLEACHAGTFNNVGREPQGSVVGAGVAARRRGTPRPGCRGFYPLAGSDARIAVESHRYTAGMSIPHCARPAADDHGARATSPATFRDTRKNVEINIGKACNNRCVFCIDGLPKPEDRSAMPWSRCRPNSRVGEDSYRSVGFLGGEPRPALASVTPLHTRGTWASRASRSPPMRRNCVCRTSRIGSLPPV